MSEKIDISKYDSINYITTLQNLCKSDINFYKSGDYISYLKQRCLSFFCGHSNFAFMHTIAGVSEPFFCYQFPDKGRDHDFQSFKKLNLVDKIPDFNKCHSDFYKIIVPVWEKVHNIIIEHQKRWKNLPIGEKVNLLEKLHSLYEGRTNNEIYYQYFIYENDYLRQQFDRFLSACDFNDWWESKALILLK